MGLSTKEASGSGSGSGIKVTDGVYANEQKIIGIKDNSGVVHEYIKKAFDIAIAIKFEGDRTLELFGNFKKGADGSVEGWGGAFTVANLFTACGLEATLDDNDRFTKADLKKLIGKSIVTVSFTSGTYEKDGATKQSYSDWNQVFAPSEDEETLRLKILDAWDKSRNKGYPNNYQYPMAKGERPTTKSSARPARATMEVVDTSDDDDLPF